MREETIQAIDRLIKTAADHWNEVLDTFDERNKKAGWDIAGMEMDATVLTLHNDLARTILTAPEYSTMFHQLKDCDG